MNIRKAGAFVGSIAAFAFAWVIVVVGFMPSTSQPGKPQIAPIIVIPAALGLLYLSWRGLRYALSARHRLYFAATAAALMIAVSVPRKIDPPENRQHIGGSWYVAAEGPEKYTLYRQKAGAFERVRIDVTRYQFSAPDCVDYWVIEQAGPSHYKACGVEAPQRMKEPQ